MDDIRFAIYESFHHPRKLPDMATPTGGRMPPSLARWKRAATVAAAILAASECGFQPRAPPSMVVMSRCAHPRTPRKSKIMSLLTSAAASLTRN